MGIISDVGGGGIGSEVLRRTYLDNAGETEATLCTGVANHIMTIISIVFCENNGIADSLFHMYMDHDLGGTNIYLLRANSVGSYSTFIWNDKIVLTDQDKLHMIGESSSGTASYDVWVSYIDQEFTT